MATEQTCDDHPYRVEPSLRCLRSTRVAYRQLVKELGMEPSVLADLWNPMRNRPWMGYLSQLACAYAHFARV